MEFATLSTEAEGGHPVISYSTLEVSISNWKFPKNILILRTKPNFRLFGLMRYYSWFAVAIQPSLEAFVIISV